MRQLTIYHCEFCGQLRPDGRSDMQYCSNSCKQKAYRWRHKMSRYETQVFKNVTDLVGYLDYQVTRQEAIERLRAIVENVHHMAAEHNVRFQSVKHGL
jgi:hypothetical protein